MLVNQIVSVLNVDPVKLGVVTTNRAAAEADAPPGVGLVFQVLPAAVPLAQRLVCAVAAGGAHGDCSDFGIMWVGMVFAQSLRLP